MSHALTLNLLVAHQVLPAHADAELHALYGSALTEFNLGLADYLTVRDLLPFAAESGRDVHALLLCLFEAMAEGSVCLRLDAAHLQRRARCLMPATPARLAADMREALARGALGGLVGQAASDYTPLIRSGMELLYFQKYYVAEFALQYTLDTIVDADTDLTPLLPGVTDATISAHLADVCASGTVTLNNEQQLALVAALLKRLVIVSGGPGTGKTSIVVAILRMLVRCGIAPDRIHLAAPTGRAAQRLTESIRLGLIGERRLIPAETTSSWLRDSETDAATLDALLLGLETHTIHRLLGCRPGTGRFIHHCHNPLPADVLIVDEVSMVDVVLMTKLLQALPPGARIILLGDRNQLPSVDAGAVLADLMPVVEPGFTSAFRLVVGAVRPGIVVPAAAASDARLADRIVLLTESYRSERSILRRAEAINTAPAADVDAPTASAAAQVIVQEIPELALPSPVATTPPADVLWPVPETAADGVTHCSDGGCRRIPADSDSAKQSWPDIVLSWARHHYVTGIDKHGRSYRDCVQAAADPVGAWDGAVYPAVFRFIDRARVLTLVHAGLRGTRAINRMVTRLARPALDPSGTDAVFAGAPVLVTSNDRTNGLFNGDVGVILGSTQHGYRAVFPRLERYISFPIDALPPHQPAFAMTVHKSQGSEYDQVLLVLPEDPAHRLLTREIVYTGLTRAKYLVVVYGSTQALQAAVANRIRRDSGLNVWENV